MASLIPLLSYGSPDFLSGRIPACFVRSSERVECPLNFLEFALGLLLGLLAPMHVRVPLRAELPVRRADLLPGGIWFDVQEFPRPAQLSCVGRWLAVAVRWPPRFTTLRSNRFGNAQVTDRVPEAVDAAVVQTARRAAHFAHAGRHPRARPYWRALAIDRHLAREAHREPRQPLGRRVQRELREPWTQFIPDAARSPRRHELHPRRHAPKRFDDPVAAPGQRLPALLVGLVPALLFLAEHHVADASDCERAQTVQDHGLRVESAE